MIKQSYKDQVTLLLTVLPEVAKEENLAMHGGTAINLFVREMPRISVDIDLTYLPIEDRTTSLKNIAAALERIKASIEKLNLDIQIDHKKDESKLLISRKGVVVKLEVNQIMRGVIFSATPMILCSTAQKEFDAYIEIAIVSTGQLHGGKICAALDRQHPRDMFDVKYILKNEAFNGEIKAGLMYSFLSSARPLQELLNPNFQDQRDAMARQFEGMTVEEFTYEEYEAIRKQL
ncbi:MAG: nucleotidyl transferase AbiEii/AbiGii toxin family protein, partial [Saprospiraceae bacterium]